MEERKVISRKGEVGLFLLEKGTVVEVVNVTLLLEEGVDKFKFIEGGVTMKVSRLNEEKESDLETEEYGREGKVTESGIEGYFKLLGGGGVWKRKKGRDIYEREEEKINIGGKRDRRDEMFIDGIG